MIFRRLYCGRAAKLYILFRAIDDLTLTFLSNLQYNIYVYAGTYIYFMMYTVMYHGVGMYFFLQPFSSGEIKSHRRSPPRRVAH